MVDKENICNWKEKILVKSNSLCKVKLFRLVICTLEGVKLTIYIYDFSCENRIRMSLICSPKVN